MNDLANRIEGGEWKVGESIPPALELQREYAFNRLTILKALNGLAREGFLSVEQGRGTFVKRQKVQMHVGMLFGDDIFNATALPFSSLMAKAAQRFFESRDRGHELKFYIEHSHLLEEGVLDRDLVNDIERNFLRGLITVGSNAPLAMARSEFWKKHAIPWVDISVFNNAAHRVVMDYGAMVTMGLDHILRSGRKRVGALAVGKDEFTDNLTPFLRLAQERGLTTRESWLPAAAQPTEKGGFEGMQRIWSGTEKPDALLIMDDVVGKGATQAMLALGIRVPDELLVVCQANKGSDIFYPISVPKIEFDPIEIMGRAGALLLELMKKPSLPARTISIRPTLRLEDDEPSRRVGEIQTMPVPMTG